MGIPENGGIPDNGGVVVSKDMRVCRFYLFYLTCMGITIPGTFNSTELCCKKINEVLSCYKNLLPRRSVFIQEMEELCQNELLSIDYFHWLKRNDRACYLIWCVIRSVSIDELNYNPPLPMKKNPDWFDRDLYDCLYVNPLPSNTNERFDSIISFFDQWLAGLDEKKMYLNELKQIWLQVENAPYPFSWLDRNNEEQCIWTWRYLKKAGIPHPMLYPLNNLERYHSIYAAFDFWKVSHQDKNSFILKINNAWGQRKHQNSHISGDAPSISIKKSTNKKLLALSKKHNKGTNDIIEMLISQEYEKNNKKMP